MELKNNKKYEVFFECLEKSSSVISWKIEDDTVILNNNFGDIILNFKDLLEKIECLEIPNINAETNNIIIKNFQCDQLIFNRFNVQGLKIIDSTINNWKFLDLKNSSGENFYYDEYDRNNYLFIFYDNWIKNQLQKEKNTGGKNNKVIPENFPFKQIKLVNVFSVKQILNNEILKNLCLEDTWANLNNYDNLEVLTILNHHQKTQLDFSQFPKLKDFKSYNNKNKLIVNIQNHDKVEKIFLKEENTKFKIENCSNLSEITLLTNSIENMKPIDLSKINSKKLSKVNIENYKLSNYDLLYNSKIKHLYINTNNSSKDILQKNDLVILPKSKNLDVFIFNEKFNFIKDFDKKIQKYDDFYMQLVKVYDFANDFVTLRGGNELMKKLLWDDLDDINSKDLELVNQPDKFGLKPISYCRTTKALNLILKNKDYKINKDDLNILETKELKSFYEKEIIKKNIKPEKNKTVKNNNKLN